MKAFVFLPLLLIFVPLLLGIIGFFFLVGKLAKNASKDEWEGEVTSKSHNTKDKEDTNNQKEHFYTLIIKTTKGEERKIPVMASIYESAKIGDKYIKVKGKLNPQKVL
jgi:hypothetical protein